MHERLDVPDVVVELSDMIAGLREHVRFVGMVSERLTVPVNPLIPDTVIVEFACLFVSTFKLLGLDVTEKSTPETETVVDDVSEPEVPVTVMIALPVVDPAFMVRIVVALPPTLRLTAGGKNVVWKPQVQPVDVVLRFTVPLKLPRLVRVIVVFTDCPAGIDTLCGFATSENPCTSTVTTVLRVVLPFVPVTVIV